MSDTRAQHTNVLSAAPERTRGRSGGIAAFIFDVDGVIADTSGLHAGAWRRVAIEEGLPVAPDLEHAVRGLSREASLRFLLSGRETPAAKFDEMMRRKNHYYEATLRVGGALAPLPGVVELIGELQSMGLKVGAASASRHGREVLGRLAVGELFDTIVDGTDATSGAAGLHRFLRVCTGLGATPDRCVVVEDAASGLATARNLGMLTIGIGDPGRLAAADLVYESLCGVDGEPLVRWLDRHQARRAGRLS
jgi:beta-phosphoglucomutase